MTVKLHWFLPTYGDSRNIVGGGHGTPAGAAGGDREAPSTIWPRSCAQPNSSVSRVR